MGYAAPQEDYQIQQQEPIDVPNVVDMTHDEFHEETGIPQTVAHVEVKPATDSFVQIVSNVNPWIIAGAVVALVIGILVIVILFLKITPMGKMVSKIWNGLKSMFDALIKWKPKGSK